MIKFYNEKSEALYYKLLDKFGKEVVYNGSNSKRLRFPIDKKLGVNRTLFAMAEYTEYEGFSNMWSTRRKQTIDKIRGLEFNASDISKLVIGNSYSRVIKKAIERSEVKAIEDKEIVKDMKSLIEKVIEINGYLLTKKVLTEELNKLDEKIKEQQNNLKAAESILSEAETEKEKCLKLLYGTE